MGGVDEKDLHPVVYAVRQYGGLLLGFIAVLGTCMGYVQNDPNNTKKLYIWFGVLLVALLMHETRPFQVCLNPCPNPYHDHKP